MSANLTNLRWTYAILACLIAMAGAETGLLAQTQGSLAALNDQCNAGDEDACLNLQALKDNEKLAEACAKGFPNGCYNLGARYQIGDGPLEVDLPRAADLFAKACELGHAYGCNDLGVLHQKGTGVTQSNGRAAVYFRKALAIDPSHEAARRNLAAVGGK